MARRSGLVRNVLAALGAAAILIGCAADPPPKKAAGPPPSYETVWRHERLASERGDLLAAERRVDEALRRAGNSDDGWVWALRILKADMMAQRDVVAARKMLEQKLPPELATSHVETRRLLSLTMVGVFSEKPKVTARRLEQARQHAAAHAPEVLPEIYLTRLYLTGSDQEVHAAIDAAQRSGNEIGLLKARAQLALVHAIRGRFEEAIAVGENVLPRLQKLGLRRSARTVMGNLGWSYFEIGDYETAEDFFKRAESEAVAMNATTEWPIWANWLGNLHFIHREWGSAQESYQKVLGIAPTIHRETAYTLAYLARVAAETSRLEDGRRLASEAVAAAREKENAEAEQAARVVLAWVDVLGGRYDTAEKELQGILAETKNAAVRSEARVRLAQLYVRTERPDLAEKYFQLAIQAGREAREKVKDEELRFSFFNALSDTFDEYVDLLVRTNRILEALAVTETSRVQTLEEGLGMTVRRRETDPRAIAKQTGATILCYWLGRHRSYVWTITPDAIAIAHLDPDLALEREVDRYVKTLLRPSGTLSMSGDLGAQLFEKLVPAPVRALTAGARVVVIPDGRLHALNFETLVKGGRYWIEDVTVSSAGSLKLLTSPHDERQTGATMLLVGNPPQVDPAFPPLSHAGEELTAIAGQFDDHFTLDGARATPDAYRAAGPAKFDFIHFAAHGTASPRRPLDSAVILGREGTKPYRLLARDIVKQPLTARLVTISSCHGVGSRQYAGEGLVGLAWAFLRAGAHEVIAALWEVNDRTTPQLIADMYSGIRAGRDPAVALRDAKLRLVRSPTVRSRPLYWAPFVLYSGS